MKTLMYSVDVLYLVNIELHEYRVPPRLSDQRARQRRAGGAGSPPRSFIRYQIDLIFWPFLRSRLRTLGRLRAGMKACDKKDLINIDVGAVLFYKYSLGSMGVRGYPD